ncbi:MAG TPA: hypothetical protein EYG71_07860 [Leucothrix sp.]|nr:hypothetical protein [Leucothrix sp.]
MFKKICWVNWLFAIMVAGLALLSLSTMLSGCGNRGSLYLPDSDKTATQVQSKQSQTKKSN